MADRKLLAIVTMMILVGSSSDVHSEPTLEDLLTIDKLIEDGDWRALYTYVNANPRLTTGQSPLAVELQSFKDEVESGQLNTFNAPPAQPAEPVAPGAEATARLY